MRQLKITQSITNRRESHTLEKYFTEVSGVPMITPEEEVRLAKLIKKGNQDALDKLVRANLRFCLLYTSPSPRDKRQSRMPSSA